MRSSKLALVIGLILGVSGCQSTPETSANAQQSTNKDIQVVASEHSFESIQAQFQLWQGKLQEHAHLELYAPENYNELTDAWSDAQSIFKDVEKDHSVITKGYSIFSSQTYAQAFDEKIATIESNYDSIMALKDKADLVLADSITQIDYLKLLGADVMFPSSYKKLYSQYSELFNYVLIDELEEAQQEQAEFIKDASVLEVKVAKKKYIDPLKAQLDLLEDEDFDEVAPLTFAKAESQIGLAEDTIKASPREKSTIEEAVKAAEFELNHVSSVAHEVKRLASVEDDRYEQSVLDAENQLLSISKAVSNEDFRDVGLHAQSQKIVASIEQLKGSDLTQKLTQEIELLTLQLVELKTQNQKQAQQLADNNKQSQLLPEQVTKSDAHTQNAEDLVKSLKKQGNAITAEATSVSDDVKTQAASSPSES